MRSFLLELLEEEVLLLLEVFLSREIQFLNLSIFAPKVHAGTILSGDQKASVDFLIFLNEVAGHYSLGILKAYFLELKNQATQTNL